MVRFSAASALLWAAGAAADTWPFATYDTGPWTPPQMKVHKSGTTEPGYIFVGPRGNQPNGTAALIYDQEGHLVYQGPTEVTANVKVQKVFNEDTLTFWAGDMTSWGYGFGTVHILDDTYREMYTVKLPDDPATGRFFATPDGNSRPSYIDLHESHVTDRNTLLVTAYNTTQYDLTPVRGAPDGWMLDALFYEIDIATNEIVFSWSALEHIAEMPLEESFQAIAPGFGTRNQPWDAYHINSVELMSDGYILSLRHYWSGLYVYNNGTIAWRLSGAHDDGDFEIDDAGLYQWQHDIRVFDETEEGFIMTLFNNVDTPSDPKIGPTTGLKFQVDLVNRKVTTLQVITNTYDEVFSVSQGSLQTLNRETGHVFMGYGSIATVKEFDGDGNEVFTASFGDPGLVASYRGYKCQWKATPFWPPAMAVVPTGPGVAEIYMSWNGATEYDNWAIYAVDGPDATTSRFVKSVKRAGYETRADVGSLRTRFLQVVARKGDIPLGTSPIVEF